MIVSKYNWFTVQSSYNYSECGRFLDKANQSLMSDFEHLQFQTVNEVIKESYFRLGRNCTELENLIAAFCETKSITNDNGESVNSKLVISSPK